MQNEKYTTKTYTFENEQFQIRSPCSDEDAYNISGIIAKNKKIGILDLHNCKLGIKGIVKICEGIHENGQIYSVDFSGNNIHCDGIKYIIEMVNNTPSLLMLNMSNTDLSDNNLKSLLDGIKEMSFALKVLNIKNNPYLVDFNIVKNALNENKIEIIHDEY
jgi:hypothetical protein